MALFRYMMATVLLLGALAAPAFAEGEGSGFREGTVTIYTRTGAILEKKISDKALLDSITRDAMVFPGGTMVVMHGGKVYMVQDSKMPDGHMLSDMVMSK